jgi:uroporphyrin-III C-methyltransferase/precorrin-2 dehydrogenase/sirohydrochlorin ferrochelatase
MARTLAADRGVPYFATFLDLLRKRVVVVGGGKVATSKVRALLPCRPSPLIVVAPRATAFIRRAADSGDLIWHPRDYAAGDLGDAVLAFGATDDRLLNARVAADARRLNVPVLAVDDVPNCDFIAPALVRRGDVSVAISTGGRSPAMARRTRERLERALPAFWGDLLEVAAAARDRLGATRSLIEPDCWQTALDGNVERLTEAGALAQATDELLANLEKTLFDSRDSQLGRVSLVGAGPGDPELLTLRAVQRLQAADVVVFDRLVSADVLAYARPDAELIDVGKAPGGRGWSQAEINTLLEKLAREGRQVVRLKGGDPFVFGRGGEEALALARAGVPFEVVPGISAALAAPAAAGIPVTHRGLSGSVTIVNGHDPAQHDWSALARGGGTLVFLMAVEHLEDIVATLLAHGRPASEAAALVQWATTSRQRVVSGPLGEIALLARAAELEPPAVLVVGPTAALGAELTRTRKQRSQGAPEPIARRFAAPLRLSEEMDEEGPIRGRAAAGVASRAAAGLGSRVAAGGPVPRG